MATVAHCLYCFESLSASLEHRKPLSLARIEELWSRFCSEHPLHDAPHGDSEPEAGAGQSEREDDEEEAKDDEDADDAGLNRRPLKARKKMAPASTLFPNNDLNAPSPSCSSSSSSTPSETSKASPMRTDSSVSVSSSRSSLSTKPHPLTSVINSLRSPSSERHPMFITWNSVGRGNSKTLRGCIGTFENQPLSEGLRTYALTSAFEDVRFPPVVASELPFLECGVTLLTDFEPAPTPMSWEIGKHGLRISFTYHSKRYGSTYLPDVAREQGWTKTETLVSLMRKAGWSGRRDEWQSVGDLNVVRYQGCKANISYETWRTWRDWVNEQPKSSIMSP